jgi:hypothetical protein
MNRTTLKHKMNEVFPYGPPHHVRWIEADVSVADRAFVAIEAGALVRTFDGGRTSVKMAFTIWMHGCHQHYEGCMNHTLCGSRTAAQALDVSK